MRGTTRALNAAAAPAIIGRQVIDLPPLCVRGDLGSVNVDARTVELVFTTGAAVERMDYRTWTRYLEKLSLKPDNIRLDRLTSGAAPLLDTHSAWSISDQIGVVEPDSVTLTSKEARATVRFSKREAVEPIFQDVRDRIIRNVSIGYRVYSFEEEQGNDNKLPVRTAIDWEPYEISMVPMPADAGAQIRKEDKFKTNPCVILTHPRSDDADRLRRFRLAMAQSQR